MRIFVYPNPIARPTRVQKSDFNLIGAVGKLAARLVLFTEAHKLVPILIALGDLLEDAPEGIDEQVAQIAGHLEAGDLDADLAVHIEAPVDVFERLLAAVIACLGSARCAQGENSVAEACGEVDGSAAIKPSPGDAYVLTARIVSVSGV